MTLDEAKEEFQRWFDYLEREKEKTRKLQQLAQDARSGTIPIREVRRREREIDGPGVTVYDGAKLHLAAKVVLAALLPAENGE